MPQTKPFGKHDWEMFAGAGENAKIGEIVVLSAEHKMEAIVVSDDDGIGIMFEDPEAEDDDNEVTLDHRCSNPKYCDLLLSSLPDEVDLEFLFEIGFLRVN